MSTVVRPTADFFPQTSFLQQTNSLGVVTGQPATDQPATSVVVGIPSVTNGGQITSLLATVPTVVASPTALTTSNSPTGALENPRPTLKKSSSVSDGSPTTSNSSPQSTTTSPASPSGGLSTGAKAAIGAVVPVVVIGIVVFVFFLLRRRKRSRASSSRRGIETTDPDGPELGASDKMVVETKHDSNVLPEKPELHGISTITAASPTIQLGDAEKRAVVSTINPYQVLHDQHLIPQQLPGDEMSDLTRAAIPPVSATGLINNDHESRLVDIHSSNDWSQRHELGTPSRTASVYSDSRTLAPAGEHGERDIYLDKLEAKRAAVAEERERLRRMEMLREEDERLEREIEEYKRTRGL